MQLLILLHELAGRFSEPQECIAPLVIAAIAMAAHSARVSYQQSRKAKEMEKGLQRPGYKTPEEIRMNLINAQRKRARASLMGLPGQGVMQNQIDAGAASQGAGMVNAGQDSASIIAGLSSLNTNVNNANAQLGVDAAEFQVGRIDQADAEVSNALQLSAAGKDKEFAYNEDEPYKARVAAIAALKESSQRNQDNALNSGLKAFGGGDMGGGNRMPQSSTGATTSPLQTTATVPNAMTEGNNTGPILAPNPTVAANRSATPNDGYGLQTPLQNNANSSDAMIDMLQRQHPQFSREQIRAMYGGLY